jgi:branched-chain amino acid transport system permease protein
MTPYPQLKQRLLQGDLRLVLPVALAFLVALPHIYGGRVIMHTYITCMMWIVLCSGFRLVLLTGRASIAQAAFMGVGAYGSGLLALEHNVNPWIGLVAGGMAAMLLATVAGFISLRLSGVYFVIITLALSEVIIRTIYWQREYTGGDLGRYGVSHYSIGGFDFGLKVEPHYYLLLFLMAVALFVMYRMEHSRIGLALTAAGQNNLLAQHVGINVTRYRVLAWAIACFFAGMVGAFWSSYLAFVAPGDYAVMQSFWVMLYVFVGGVTSFWGPVVGAIAITFILEEITSLQDYQILVFGAIVIIITMFLRGGLVTLLSRLIFAVKKIEAIVRRKKVAKECC